MPTLLEFACKFLPMEDLDLPLGETEIYYNSLSRNTDITNVFSDLKFCNRVVTVSSYISPIGLLQITQ